MNLASFRKTVCWLMRFFWWCDLHCPGLRDYMKTDISRKNWVCLWLPLRKWPSRDSTNR